MHRVPSLWRLHAIHHSSSTMDWLAPNRRHVFDTALGQAASIIPLLAIGLSPPMVTGWFVLRRAQGLFVHANLRWEFPLLRWFVATPHFHHWHHSADPRFFDTNFAGQCPALDWLFGTLHMPAKEWPESYGLPAPGRAIPKRIPCPIGVALSGRSGRSRVGAGPWPSPTSTGSGRRALVGRAGGRRSRVGNHACPAGLVVLLHGHDPISVGCDQSRGGGCTTRRRRAGSDPAGLDGGDAFARSRPPSGPTIGSAAHDQNRGPSVRVDSGRGRRGKCRSVSAPSLDYSFRVGWGGFLWLGCQ